MGAIRTAANDELRDYVTSGLPASGAYKPTKSGLRNVFVLIDDELSEIAALATTAIRWTTNTVRVRSTGNVAIATALENGDTLNGVTLATGDVVFLGSQTAPAENGLYVVPASGAASRVSWANTAAELAYIGFLVSEGTTGAGERYTLPLSAADITLEATALTFARIGVEVDVSGEVASARAGESTLGDRLDLIEANPALSKADWAVRYGATWDTASITGGDLASLGEISRTNDFSGWGDILEPPAATVKGIYLPTAKLASGGSAGGVTTPRKPVRIDVTARTGAAGAADNAGATVVAVGSVAVDPDASPWNELFIPFRDPATTDFSTNTLGAFIDVDPGDWSEEVGLIYQGWDADGNPASLEEILGTHPDRVSPNRSYYVGAQNARTDAWNPLTGNAGIAIQWATFTNLRDEYAPSEELLSALGGETLSVPAQGIYGDWRLRQIRSRLALLKTSATKQLDIGFIGDSWTDATFRYTEALAEIMTAEYGDAGMGWAGFGFLGGNAAHGNARGETYVVTRSGSWTSDFFNGSSYGPDVSNCKSSTAGDKLTLIAYAEASAVHSEIRMFWEGTADGVVRYRFGDYDGSGSRGDTANYALGSWTSLNVQGSGHQSAALGSLPATANFALEIEVVSGSVRLNGLNGKSDGNGVRIHKLGCTGSKATDWTASDATEWQEAMTTLALDACFVMFGTNEKAQGQAPSTFATSLTDLLTRIRTALPACDLGVAMPAENIEDGSYTMADYATAAFAVAEAMDAAWVNLQPFFGLSAEDYAYGSDRSWMLSDNVHPVAASYRSYHEDDELIGIIPAAFMQAIKG